MARLCCCSAARPCCGRVCAAHLCPDGPVEPALAGLGRTRAGCRSAAAQNAPKTSRSNCSTPCARARRSAASSAASSPRASAASATARSSCTASSRAEQARPSAARLHRPLRTACHAGPGPSWRRPPLPFDVGQDHRDAGRVEDRRASAARPRTASRRPPCRRRAGGARTRRPNHRSGGGACARSAAGRGTQRATAGTGGLCRGARREALAHHPSPAGLPCAGTLPSRLIPWREAPPRTGEGAAPGRWDRPFRRACPAQQPRPLPFASRPTTGRTTIARRGAARGETGSGQPGLSTVPQARLG
jgi:hypothetical protein